MILPLNVGTAVVAIGLLAASGLRTVTQVWLAVVALLYVCQTLASSVLAGSRYTLGWYSGRGFVFGGASVLLAVFLVKINDLVERLASRNAEGEQRYRSLAQRTQMRENFLAAAGDQLSASLDLQATLATIGEVLSWTIVRWSRVDLIDDAGRFTNVSTAAARRLAEILAAGEPVIEHDLAVLDAAALRGGAIVVPLVSGNAPLGTLTLAYDDPSHPDAEHLWIARDFERRAAVALDHAQRLRARTPRPTRSSARCCRR